MRVRKNDLVEVIAGKESGKRGKVLEVLPDAGRVRVEGLQMVKRHLRAGRNPRIPEGGIIEKEGTIHISNVMPVCPKCGKPSRVGHTVQENGAKVRTCKACGGEIIA